MTQPAGRVVIYGGKGHLGKVCVSKFKSNNWWVASIAFAANEQADANILVLRTDNVQEQERKILDGLKSALGQNKLDAIVCVTGDYARGNAAEDFVKKSNLMWKQNVCTSEIGAVAATRYLKNGGLLAFTGSSNALTPNPNGLPYALSKAAVHYLTRTLGNNGSGLPAGAICAAILPDYLDTELSRSVRPNADFSTWTPLEFCADVFWKWANNKERPANGSLCKLVTKNSITEMIVL